MTRPGFEVTNLPNIIVSVDGIDVIAYYGENEEIFAVNVGGTLVTDHGDVTAWCNRFELYEHLEASL